MLTNKNRAAQAISTLLTTVFLLVFTGCQPSGPKSLLLGDKYVRQGEYPKALKYLGRAAVFMPERPEVWNLQGLAYLGMQQPGRAAEAYQRALRIDRSFAPAHYNLGLLLLEQDRAGDAINELNAYVALQPNDDQGWSRLGDALVRARKTDEADRALSQALKLNAKNADAHNSLGLVHIQRKRPREAMQSFNAALQYRSGFGAALLNQAIVAQQYFGNNQIALERYRAFLSTKPNAKAAAAVQTAIKQIEQGSVETTAPVALADLTTNTGISALLRSNLAQQAERSRATDAQMETPSNVVAQVPATPKTNLPAPTATQQVAHLSATNPPVTTVAANEKTNAPDHEEEVEKPLPVEVVKVAKEPEVPLARDLDAEITGPAPNRTRIEEPPLIPPKKKAEEEKRGFLAHLKQANPAHWFQHEEPKTAPTPASRSTATVPPASETPVPTPARTAPPIQPPPVPRYDYRKDLASTKGNRAQAQKFFAQAGNAYEQHRLAEAVALYQQAVKTDPSYFEANYNLGLVAYQTKDLPVALSAGEQAVLLRPNSTDARYNFALALREAGYYVDAANELRELLNAAPNQARAHLALGNLYAQLLDEPALARNHYQRFLELSPNHADASAVRQWLFAHP